MPEPDPFLTIAMPVFNGGVALRLAVQSVINQSFTDWELLLIDDGSTDGAVEQLTAARDPRIHIIRDGSNKGLSARLNQAIELARGVYFARMDHDDICHPKRFERQIAFLKANPQTDLLGTQCVTMDEAEQINGTLPIAITHADICAKPWLGFYLPHPTWVGKTPWFKQHLYQDPAPYCCEDQELLLRAAPHSHYHTLPEYLLAYRVKNNPAWKKLLRTRLAFFKVQRTYFMRHGAYAKMMLSFCGFVLRVIIDAMNAAAASLNSRRRLQTPSSELPAESAYWQDLIATLKIQVGKEMKA